jgi:hypothetical protein
MSKALTKTNIKTLAKYIYEYIDIDIQDEIVLKFKKPIRLVIPGDFEITTQGEVSILALKNIHLDSNEIHLNSRNCKQMRKMKEPELQEIYASIPEIEFDEVLYSV